MTDKPDDTPRLIATMVEDHTQFGQDLDTLHRLVTGGMDPSGARETVE